MSPIEHTVFHISQVMNMGRFVRMGVLGGQESQWFLSITVDRYSYIISRGRMRIHVTFGHRSICGANTGSTAKSKHRQTGLSRTPF